MPDGKVAAWAIEQLAADYEQPFFMGVGFYRPHQPLFAPPRFFEMFPPGSVDLPVTTPRDVDDLPTYAQRLARLPLTAGSHATVTNYDQWDDAVIGYLACVRFVDELLGQVLDALDRSAHADNTLIVLFSDHGYHLGEKQHWGKFTPWQESTHIPLFVVPPRDGPTADTAAGKEVSVPVSLVDLFPTVVDLCAIDQPPHQLDGQSVRALIEGAEGDADRWAERTVITTVGRGTHAVRSSRYRYILYVDGAEELYDLQLDPHEWRNRADDPQYAAIKQKLSASLPADESVKHYVRYGDWKAVIFQDDQEPALLFEVAPGTGSGGGIGETRSVAAQHPDVMRQIRSYLTQHNGAAKRVVVPVE
jgi:arylsulfatase A-like enzyme